MACSLRLARKKSLIAHMGLGYLAKDAKSTICIRVLNYSGNGIRSHIDFLQATQEQRCYAEIL